MGRPAPWRVAIRISHLPLWIMLPLAALPFPAQDNPPAPVGLEEQVSVQLVQLSFLASDRSGRPVTDLRMDEIEILEGGKRQKLAFLEPYYGREKTGVAPETRGASPAPGPRSPSRWLVLLLDAFTSSPRTRVRSLEAIRGFVEESLGPQDRAAIAVFDGKLDFLQTFTADRALLLRAANVPDSVLEQAAQDRPRAVSDLLEGMESCRSQGSLAANCAQRLAAEYEDSRLREARDLVYALTALSRAVAPIPDVKAVILFSDGFSREPFGDAFDAARATLGFETARRLSPNAAGRLDHDLADLVATAAMSQVAFFTIYPGGGAGRSSVSAERGSMPSERRNPENIDVYRRSEQNFGQGLIDIARRSGGHFSQGSDVSLQLASAWNLTSGLYAAGYYLSDASSSGSREIRIRCHRKGVVIESRRQSVATPHASGPRATVKTTSEPCQEKSRRLATIHLSVDPSTIAYQPQPGGRRADLSIYVSVADPSDSHLLWEDYRFLRVDEPAGQAPEPLGMEHTLRVPCRPLSVDVVVADVNRGSRTTVSAELPR